MGEIQARLLSDLRAVWRRRWFIVSIAWAVCLAGWGVVLILPDNYESRTRIYVDTQTMLAPLLRGIAVSSNLDQQVAFMKRTLLSRPNLEQVARMTDLDLTAETDRDMDSLLDTLAKQIAIRSQGEDLFTLSYRHENPQMAQRVVSSLVNIFVEDNLGQNRQDMEKARAFVEAQIAQYERQLRSAEKRLAEFRAANLQYTAGGGNFLQRVEGAAASLKAQQSELSDLIATRERMRQQLESIPQFISVDSQPQVVINNERVLSSEDALRSRIQDVERNLDALLGQYTDQHPDVKAARRTLEKLQAQLDGMDQLVVASDNADGAASDSQSLNSSEPKSLIPNQVYETLKLRLLDIDAFISSKERRVETARDTLEKAQAQAATAPAVEARLADLNRDYEVIKANYEQLLARRESARIAQAVDAETDIQFRIVDPPQVPTIPTGPNRPLFMTMVFVIGIGGGVAFAYLLAQMDVSFSSSNSLRDAIGLPVLGAVSSIGTGDVTSVRVARLAAFGIMFGILVAAYGGMMLFGGELSENIRELGLERLL